MPDSLQTSTIPRKTMLSIGIFVLIMAALPYIPGSRHLAGVPPRLFLGAFALPVFKTGSPPAEAHVASLPVTSVHAGIERKPPIPASPDLNIPPGSLDTFFAALRRTARKEPGAVTRILHYGDSPTTADSITADMRRLLQARFGDAGHGFVLIAKPWAWYGHHGVSLDAKGWHIEPASQSRAADGIHGLGGVSFRGETGAFSRVTLPDALHSHATVYYLAQPGGGGFTVYAEDKEICRVNTASPDPDVKRPAFAEFALPKGTESIELRVTSGKVRLFGYRFDKDGPGVEYSSLGVNGAQVQMIVRYFEVSQWTAVVRHENPDLIVLNYGTNESIYPEYIEKQYPNELRTVITRIRNAVPKASLLVMSPMDRGILESGGEIATPPALQRLIEVQRRIAAETGCAFFDTFDAMGGAGTMGRWYHSQPRLVSADFMHPLPQGAAKVGALFEGALVAAFEATNPESSRQ